MNRLWAGSGIALLAVGVGVLIAAIPILVFWLAGGGQTAYPVARMIAASLSTGIAAGGAFAAVHQYFRNSRDKRIERSMEFWRRSNSGEVKKELTEFINYWSEVRAGTAGKDFEELARTDDHELSNEWRRRKLRIEYLLDFYDEACCAAVIGTCDLCAMYLYLGPVMILHRDRLASFIAIWREKHSRPEKWDGFTQLTAWFVANRPMLDHMCGALRRSVRS
jgi:hypothetical protein